MTASDYETDDATPQKPGRLIAIVVLVAAILLVGIGFAITMSHMDQKRTQARQTWDTGAEHPEAGLIVRDRTEVKSYVPQTIGSVNEYWDTCSGDSCAKQDIGHYPLVFKLDSLAYDNTGCFVIWPKVPVGSLRMASSRSGSQYTLAYSPSGSRLTLCHLSDPKKGDQMVTWSNDIAATR